MLVEYVSFLETVIANAVQNRLTIISPYEPRGTETSSNGGKWANLDAMFHILVNILLDALASPNARYKEKWHYSSIEESRKRINNGTRCGNFEGI